MPSVNDKIKEIIAGLGDDDDFVDEVKRQLNYEEVVAEALQDDGVKRAFRKSVLAVLKSVFEEDDDDDNSIADAVKEQIDFSQLVRDALADPAVQKELKGSVVAEITRAIKDGDDWFSEAITEAVSDELDVKGIVKELHDNDEAFKKLVAAAISKKLADDLENDDLEVGDCVGRAIDWEAEAKALLAAGNPELKKAIAALIVHDLEERNEGLDENEREQVWKGLDVESFVQGMLKDPQLKEKLMTTIRESVESEIENLGQEQSGGIAKKILDAESFTSAVNRIVTDLYSSGKVDEFARGIVERALRESRRFQEMVLDQVQAAIATKVAGAIVETAFPGKR